MSVFRSILAVAIVFLVVFGTNGKAQGVVDSQVVTVAYAEPEETDLADAVETVVAVVLVLLLVILALAILNNSVKGGN